MIPLNSAPSEWAPHIVVCAVPFWPLIFEKILLRFLSLQANSKSPLKNNARSERECCKAAALLLPYTGVHEAVPQSRNFVVLGQSSKFGPPSYGTGHISSVNRCAVAYVPIVSLFAVSTNETFEKVDGELCLKSRQVE